MSAYLKFFELEQSPFEGKAQSKVVLGTRALRDAFKAIRGGLEEGSARICLSGGPGFGKTSLARSLPKLLGDTARVALVRDPSVPWESLREQISKQWGLEAHGLARTQLLEASRERRLVLVVDRAEYASEEFLDHLDIMLSIRSETDEPAVQSILLACLSGTSQGEPAPIVWWLDRIQTLDLEFAPIPRDDVESYIHKHLKRAGWRGERLFSSEAALAIAGVTGGVPGEISRFCEELLAEAAERGHQVIDAEFVQDMIDASDDGNDSGIALESSDADCDAIGTVDSVCAVGSVDHVHDVDTAAGAETDDKLELVQLAGDGGGGDTPPDDSNLADDELNASHTAISLAHTLERFERTEADVSAVSMDSCDEQEAESDCSDAHVYVEHLTEEDSLAALEDYLDAPVSPEELRAIRSGGLRQQLRAIVAILVAALIGAVAFAWLGHNPEQAAVPESRKSDRPRLSMLESTKPSTHDVATRTLARVGGQVASIETPAGSPFPKEPRPITRPDWGGAPTSSALTEAAPVIMPPNSQILPRTAQQESAHQGEFPESPWDEGEIEEGKEGKLSPDDFEDMRPASMRPDAAADFEDEPQF